MSKTYDSVNKYIYAASFLGLFSYATVVKKKDYSRLKIIKQQLAQADTISQISSDMLSINTDNIDEKIIRFLQSVGNYYEVDRVGITQLSKDGLSLNYGVEWIAPGIESLNNKGRKISVADSLWWSEQISCKNVCVVSDINEISSIMSIGSATKSALGVKSLMTVPIETNNRLYGFLVLHSVKKQKTWRADQKKMLTVLANILGDAYNKAETEKEINRLAYVDILTGLPNRFMFNAILEDALIDAKLHNTKLAVLFIDLDSFKSVNDTMGHEGGDALLSEVAKTLVDVLGPNDFAARFGGDEFIVLMTQFDEVKEISERSKNIMATFSKPIKVNNQDFFVTASSGISVYPYDGTDRDTLIKNADLAMYTSKDLGKCQITFCTSAMKEEVERKVFLTNKLYEAVQNNEFVLYYQPQVNIATKQIIGMEALIRWNSPELGMISPCVFIPLAEQSGLINPIGQWVFETACRQNKKWQDMGLPPVRMAVNLSIEQFHNPNLVEMISQVIKETGLDAKYIELEITESVAIKETSNVIPVLSDLKALGVTISIDDFGTEYSSLARIKNLPIDRIKMAMEFVHGITVSEKDEAIGKVILTLASNLGLKVIAEGVETEKQLNFLEKRVCDEVQGFYFYKPMPAGEVEKILMRNKLNPRY